MSISKYAEDIGYIKASVKALKQTQEHQQQCLDVLMADQVFRKKLRMMLKTILFIIIAIATLKFGDIPKMF